MSHLQAQHIRELRYKRRSKSFVANVERENARMDAQTGGAVVSVPDTTNATVRPDIPAPWEGESAWLKPVASPRPIPKSSMVTVLEKDAILRDLERIHDALEWVDGPDASYARRLAARLGARLRGDTPS